MGHHSEHSEARKIFYTSFRVVLEWRGTASRGAVIALNASKRWWVGTRWWVAMQRRDVCGWTNKGGRTRWWNEGVRTSRAEDATRVRATAISEAREILYACVRGSSSLRGMTSRGMVIAVSASKRWWTAREENRVGRRKKVVGTELAPQVNSTRRYSTASNSWPKTPA